MKKSVKSSFEQRIRIAWQCVGLFVLFAGVAAAQEVPSQNGSAKQLDSLPRATTFSDPASAVEQVHFGVVMAVIPHDGLDDWATTHKADIKRIEVKSGEPARTKPALQFDPEVRLALLKKLKGNPAASLMHFPAAVTVSGREVTVNTGDVPEEEGGMSVKLKPTQIGKGELRLEIASEFRLSDELKKVVPPTSWNLNLRTRADDTFLLPLAELGKQQRIVLLIQPKIVAPVRATILGTPPAVPPRRVTGFAPPAKTVTTDVSAADVPAAPAFVYQPSPYPSTSPPAGYAAPRGQQVHLEVLFAIVPDEVLVKWAIPRKAIIKRVTSNESRPAPVRKREPAASRQFSLMFGSETPVPLLFDAELRESLLTELKRDTRTNILAAPSVMTTWGSEANIKTDSGNEKKSPLSLKLKPTPIGKGELGLVIDAEVSSAPGVPGGKKSHWNLRARAGHTLMLPLAQPDLEKQLVLFVVPKIIAERPVTPYSTPQYIGAIPPVRYQPVTPNQSRTVYAPQYQTVPPKVYSRVPATRYQPVPQTSYRPAPQTTLASPAKTEVVAISADFVVAAANLIPDRTVEFTPEQRKSWFKKLTESKTAKRQQINTAGFWNKATRLTTPRVKGSEAPFDLKITPKKGKDGQVILEVGGGLNTLWPEKDEKIGLDTTLKTKPNTTVLIPLPIHHPDGRHVALLIQPSIIASSPAPVTPPRAVAGTPEKDVAILQMLVLDVDAKIAQKVVGETRTQEEKLSEVDIQLPNEKGSKKRNKKRKVQQRTFVMNSSLGKLFIADLRKQDESFKVVSRPQVRTLVGVTAALEIHGGKDPSKQVAGVGTLKMFVTPKEIDDRLSVSTRLTLLGPGNSLPPEEWTQGLKVEAESTQRGIPGETAVMMLGGKESDRTIVLLTDLIHLEKGQPGSTPPVAQVLPSPPKSTGDPQAVMQEWQRRINPYAAASTAPASTDMRLVTLQAITGSGVANGDTVDVLLGYAEDGDIEKAKVEMLCESVKVYESTRASYDSTTSVTLLVKKDQVETLLLGQLKGTLRLSLHKSSVQHRNLSLPGATLPSYGAAWPNYGQPVSPYRGPIVYRDNGTWGPPDSPIQASGVQSPQPLSKKEPKSEVQQVLEEVREMRKMIQGLREDMNQLRNSVRPGIKDLAPQTDLWLPKGTSQTVRREKRIIRVGGFDPDVVGVHAKSANSVVIFGNRPGRSTVELCFEGEDKSTEEIVVAVVTERPIGDLPMLTRPKAASHEPPLTGARRTPLKPIARPQGPHTDVRVSVHRSLRVHRERKFSRIAITAPEIADFVQYSLYEAGIIGKKAGSTDLMIWYEDDPTPETFEIVVVAPSGGDDPYSSTGSKEEDAARRQIEQALKKTVSIDITDGTLKDALKQLHQTAGVNIAIDSVALEDEGVTTDVKVSLHLSGVTLRSALKILLSPYNLTTLIEDEVLKVTSQVRAQGAMVAVVYQVKDLIQTYKDGKADFDSLIELITSVVEPDSWQEVGGMGAVAPNTHTMSLVVRQTQAAHEEIQQLFSALRKWNPGDGPATSDLELKIGPDQKGLDRLRATDWIPKPKRNGQIPHPVTNPLERTISVRFEDSTLKDVLSHVATAVDVKLVIDRKAIEAEGVKEDSPVSMNVDHIMAKSALKLLLEPLKLGAVLEGQETLKVTSLSQLKERPTVRIYSVSHLIADPRVIDLKKLNDVITSSVAPTSWQEVGGEGSIASNEKTKSLVIRQNEAAHREIAELLKQLADLQISPRDTIQARPPQTSNRSKPAAALPEKPPGDTGAPIAVPRRR